MELTKTVTNCQVNQDPNKLHEAICRDAANNVDANFVSIWRFDEQLTKIVCLYAMDVSTGETSCGQELMRADFPKYFDTILEETTICAPDACVHYQTNELAEAYFEPNGIVSLLDFIVHQDFKPVGIICCESKGRKRDWSAENVSYLRNLATFTSFKVKV